MSAKMWVKWLSVIALILVAIDFITSISSMISGEIIEPLTQLAVLLLAIVSVIWAFSKK